LQILEALKLLKNNKLEKKGKTVDSLVWVLTGIFEMRENWGFEKLS
jgi:hypothetical protein